MKIPFIIFIRALGLYALVTLPAIVLPVIYIFSLGYAFLYGWFAWVLFTILSIVIIRKTEVHHFRMVLLTIAVPVSVAFAFQMIELLGGWDDVWHSGEFLLFPIAATIAGWVSLLVADKQLQSVKEDELQSDNENIFHEAE